MYYICSMKIDINPLKTVKSYADMQKVTTAYIYKLCKSGRINPVTIDGVMFVDISKFPTLKS